jgi:RNA polymerase sigma-70 factor (ECF subfamily)
MTRGEEFQELRPLLFAIAYRILGSVAEAEDAVQETWLRYESSPTQPTSTKAFLSAVVTRISIDVLRSARVRRETYVGPWFPEPLLTDPYEDPARSAELADSLSMAALLLLERLSPLERAVFVLREVFGFGFPEIAAAVGRSEPACRQLAVRARRHMEAGRPRFEADRREREELAARFFDALRNGDVDQLRELLAADVSMVGDGGGKAPALPKSVIGADNVARVLASIFPVLAQDRGERGGTRVERPAGRDHSRSGRQCRGHDDARRDRRADPNDPLGGQPRQARARRSRGGRLGDCPRGETGSPAQRLTALHGSLP